MFKTKLLAVLTALGLVDKAKSNTLTPEEWTNIESAFLAQYGVDMASAMSENSQSSALSAERQAALDLINANTEAAASTATEATPVNGAPATAATQEPTLVQGIQTIIGKVNSLSSENATLRTQVEQIASRAVQDLPVQTVQRTITLSGPGTTATHLFGIENSFFSMEKRWNQVAANPAIATITPVDEEEVAPAFQREVRSYGKTLAARYAYLQQANLLNPAKLGAAFGNDYAGLTDAKLGDQYMVLRQDALIARIVELQDNYDLFPRQYGIQDRALMTNAFFTEISQAYQVGNVFKGDMTLQPEIAHVDDAMAKLMFGPMKEIERKYIGYLNKEGSDPVKWSMIEFQLLQIFKSMVSEQNRRVIRGIYVKPESGIAGNSLNASTGLLYTLVRYMHENTLLPHDDASYNTYSKTTMYEAVKEFIADVKESLDDDINLEGFALYLNKNHRDWWLECIRTAFGTQQDFTGPLSYANNVPDTTLPIKWVNNMGQLKFMFIQEPGNLQAIEFVPGEMLAMKMTEDMEQVKGWSTWKEGFAANFIGKHFASLATLKANSYKMQRIFCTKPVVDLAADATTITAGNNFWFRTIANTAAKALTDITDAKPGVAYIIECGDVTNATTIAKADKFATLTAAYTPVAVGDYIMVVLNSEGKFLDLERCVNGVRSINTALQPNIPGAR